MTPRQLKYFLRIAEFGSFTKAAAVLHIAQPALSRQIQQLESDLGVPLFIRLDSGVALTEAGAALAAKAQSLLEHFAAVRDEVSAISSEVKGHLQFGVPPSLFHAVTVPMLLRYKQRFPEVTLGITEGVSTTVYELILEGRLDFGIVLSIESMQGLQRCDLFAESMCLAGKPGTLKEADSIALAAAARYPLILTQRPNATRRVLEDSLRENKLKFECVLEADSTRVQTTMAAAGIGYAVLPYSAVADDVKNKRLVALPIDGLSIGWTMIYAKERFLSNAAQHLIDILLEQAVSEAQTSSWPGFELRTPTAEASLKIS